MTLSSQSKRFMLERDNAIRVLDEIDKWLKHELYNKSHTIDKMEAFMFTRQNINYYRKKYRI